ncbi:keto-hydroxyglutarate-aldolase/keto-deoxy-phosphogluconate aldolase [compost metagenome]
MPTGGVNKENINEWFRVGADCTGIGSDLNKAYNISGVEGVKIYCKHVIEEIY